jgi:hypothetical protein
MKRISHFRTIPGVLDAWPLFHLNPAVIDAVI